MRYEIFEVLSTKRACTAQGVDLFVGMLLLAHHAFFTEVQTIEDDDDEPDDPWRTLADDIKEWLNGGRIRLLTAMLASVFFCCGAFMATNQFTRSTYICHPDFESRAGANFLQVIALFMDAFIIVALWRITAWIDSPGRRIQQLLVFLSACTSNTFIFGLLKASFGGGNPYVASYLAAFKLLPVLWTLVDGLVLSLLVLSLVLWTCDSSPVASVNITTIFVGVVTAADNVVRFGDWRHLSAISSVAPLWFIVSSGTVFTHALDLKYIGIFRRDLYNVVLAMFLLAASCLLLTLQPAIYNNIHPINDLMYRAQQDYAAWHTSATTSNNIRTATTVYKENYNGRNPPPKFEEWFQLASKRTVIDRFDQLHHNLEPFWSLSPADIRKRVELALLQDDVQALVIKDGEAAWQNDTFLSIPRSQGTLFMFLVDSVNKFAKHLPDMTLPINVNEFPRVLVEYESDAAKFSSAGVQKDLGDDYKYPRLSARELRTAHRKACKDRNVMHQQPYYTGPHEFCDDCVKHHSQRQLFHHGGWQKSLELCLQPDLLDLHGFFTMEKERLVIPDLLPIFSIAKTDMFSDILIPPLMVELALDKEPFADHRNELTSRVYIDVSSMTKQTLRGSHLTRALHILNDPSSRDQSVVVKRTLTSEDEARYEYAYEKTKDISWLLSNDVKALTNGAETSPLGSLPASWDAKTDNNALEDWMPGSRHHLLLDQDGQPALSTLASFSLNSVPFVSTIFQTWYSDRIWPWVHFAPIDPRYHALFSTMSYFSGKDYSDRVDTPGSKDAAWIAHEGQQWFFHALDSQDADLYLFRLLLEWARLISDDRAILV